MDVLKAAMNFIGANIALKDIISELLRAAIAAIFGYATFVIYQRYKNKKDNNLLYIQIIKLEKEMLNNIKKLKNVKGKHDELESLKNQFSSPPGEELRKFYSKVDSLSSYYYFEPVRDQRGNQIGLEATYCDVPYEEMGNLSSYISHLESQDYYDSDLVESLKTDLEDMKKKSIYKDLKELEAYSEILQPNDSFKEPLEKFFEMVRDFNALEIHERKKNLESFCSSILDDENCFTKTLKEYRRLTALRRELKKSKIVNPTDLIEIEFELWKDLDTDLLAVYDLKTYLAMSDYYAEQEKLAIPISEKSAIQSVFVEIENNLKPLLTNTKTKLKKTLDKTNWLFKDI